MEPKYRYLGTLALLVVASCGTDSTAGEKKKAGGQSGTDADGGQYCNYYLGEAGGDVTPLTQSLAGGLTPNDYYDNIEGSYDFSCSSGIQISVSIQRGTEARTTLALSGNPEVPSEDCPALQLDASVHVEASDGSLTHEASFLTAWLNGGGAYTSYMPGGQPLSIGGKDVELRLNTDYSGPNAGRITGLYYSGIGVTSVSCELATEQAEGGRGGAG
jgi:hypothetical protein